MKSLPSGLMIQDAREDVSLQQKLVTHCERFRAKLGRWPTTVWLHRETLGDYVSPNGLKLEASRYCQLNIFLIGPLPKGGYQK